MPSVENDGGSFDDLLDSAPTQEEKERLASMKDNGVPAETPEQARIRELEAALAAATAQKEEEPEKTPEQKNLEHSQAVRANAAALNAPESFEEASDDDEFITIHVLHTGLTFADRVWNYGQTVRFSRNGRAYKDTIDRNGNSWLDHLSPAEQRAKFGKIVVGLGVYDGPEFNDEISKQDASRGNAAPVINIR